MRVEVITNVYITHNSKKIAGPFESEKEALKYAAKKGWEVA